MESSRNPEIVEINLEFEPERTDERGNIFYKNPINKLTPDQQKLLGQLLGKGGADHRFRYLKKGAIYTLNSKKIKLNHDLFYYQRNGVPPFGFAIREEVENQKLEIDPSDNGSIAFDLTQMGGSALIFKLKGFLLADEDNSLNYSNNEVYLAKAQIVKKREGFKA